MNARAFLVGIGLGCLAVVAVLVATRYGAPAVGTMLGAPSAQKMPALALAACPLPSEHELLHIVVTNNGRRLTAECMHVGSTGTYTRRRP